MKKPTSRIATAGLFVAIGLILPYSVSHAFGIPGTVLLPMHIPILLCGLLCGAQLGAISGLIVPVLSSMLTGMPAAYPMLPIMAAQLFVLGLVSGLMFCTWKRNIYLSMLISMLCGWAAYGLTFAILLFSSENGSIGALSVTAAIVKGLPGILIQLVLTPLVITIAQKLKNRG